jgi:hypothetical protein
MYSPARSPQNPSGSSMDRSYIAWYSSRVFRYARSRTKSAGSINSPSCCIDSIASAIDVSPLSIL